MNSTSFLSNFYKHLEERWKQTISSFSTPPEATTEVPRLSSLAHKVLLQSPLVCPTATFPTSGIKRVLPNGFEVYLQQIQNPRAEIPTVSISLVVKAGHIHEADHERGIAHFLEHSVSLGTKNFSHEEIQELFKALGCSPGADQNATTDYISTSHYLNRVPIQNQEILKKCLGLFYDFCTCPLLPQESILKERSVVLNELLYGKGIREMQVKNFPANHCLNTRFYSRSELELSTEIKNANGVELQRLLQSFHQKWYRPSNIALIIAGNFGDAFGRADKQNQLLKEIEQLFGKIPPAPVIDHALEIGPFIDNKFHVTLPIRNELQLSSQQHSDFPNDLIFFTKRVQIPNPDDVKQTLAHNLIGTIFNVILKKRLDNTSRQNNGDLIIASPVPAPIDFFDSRSYFYSLSANKDCSKKAIKLFFTEIKRLEHYGVQDAELTAALSYYLSLLTTHLALAPIQPPRFITANYTDYFLHKKNYVYHTAHAMYQLFRIKTCDFKDLNDKIVKHAKLFTDFKQSEVCFKLFSSSMIEKGELDEIKLFLDNLDREKITPLQDLSFDADWAKELENLQAIPPVKNDQHLAIQAYSWHFLNGIEAAYKPIDSIGSMTQMLFEVPFLFLDACSFNDYLSLQIGFQVLNKIGIKDKNYSSFSLFKINKLIKMNANQSIDGWRISFTLDTPEHLETALQILHSRLTNMEPLLSKEFEEGWNAELQNYIAYWKETSDPEQGYMRIGEFNLKYENHPLLKVLEAAELEALTLNEARRLLMHCFKAIAQATLSITGPRLENKTVEGLLSKYIGSLSTSHEVTTKSFIPFSFTAGKEWILRKGTVKDRSTVALCFQVPSMSFTIQASLFEEITTSVFNQYLYDNIRSKQHSYTVQFKQQPITQLMDWSPAIINFECEPSQVESTTSVILNTLDSILQLSNEDLEKYLNEQKAVWKKQLALRRNLSNYWFAKLPYYLASKTPLNDIAQEEKWVEAMDIDTLRKNLNILLSKRNSFKKLIIHPKEDL